MDNKNPHKRPTIFSIVSSLLTMKNTFVSTLQQNKINRLIDTRLQNTSQLAGFTKKDDLAFILELLHTDYVHDLSLAPTESR
ncbi:DUF488 family protein [Bacillus sp. SD075]|uniref:DUF488 family protein n=1 Tax=Bacillus sp. SD075 TaxID=2781732 RepID=UPI0025711083|nr:DUF488 family protein [Bacillus sp. SD075]